MTTPPWCGEKVMVYYYYNYFLPIIINRDYVYYYFIFIRNTLLFFPFFFVPALLLFILTPLVLPSSSASLFYFILAVPMRECFGKHSCMSSPFPITIRMVPSFFARRNSPCFDRRFPYQNLILLMLTVLV